MSEHPDKYANKLLGHEYDGIQEYDNPLPGWWTWMSIGSVITAILYVIWMHGGMGGPTQVEELKAEMETAAKLYPNATPAPTAAAGGATGAPAGPPVPEIDESQYKGNAAAIAEGKKMFVTYCAPCHLVEATGKIGPNLTDATWIHGGKYSDIRRTITQGVPAKGMVTWAGVLTTEQIAQLAAHVHSLGGGQE